MAQINLPLDIESLEIVSQTIDNKGDIIIEVVSKNDHSTCYKCGKPATKRDGKAPIRVIRHLPLFNTPVYLKITPARYSCEYCDDHPTTTEQYDWCDRNASTTKRLEDYLMLCLINSTIEDASKKCKIGYQIVESVLHHQIEKKTDWAKIGNLDTIGIDEIAIKSDKGFDQSELWMGKYVTPKLFIRYMVGLFDQAFALQLSSGGGHAHPAHAQHVGQELVRDVELRTVGAVLAHQQPARQALADAELQLQLKAEALDVSLPGRQRGLGGRYRRRLRRNR